MSDTPYDLMVIGTGPAGITTGLYAQRMGLQTVVFGDIPGGNTYMIEKIANYPGFVGGVTGAEFGVSAFKQAQDEGVTFTLTRIKGLAKAGDGFNGTDTGGKSYTARAAVLATGRVPKRLSVPNIRVKGIHFCSICDGPLFRGKDAVLAVIGSDNAAGQHALTLSRVAKQVVLICRTDRLRMDAVYAKMVEQQENIVVHPGTEVVDFKGLDLIEGVTVSTQQSVESVIPVDGVFMAIGWRPNTGMLEVDVEKTGDGYVKTDRYFMTSLPGLFAAGDVRDTDMQQVLTACADGARAAKYAAEYLERLAQNR